MIKIDAISIITPTYNERENLPKLMETIDDALADYDWQYQIIVVDDDSPDGTYEVAQELAKEYPILPIRREHKCGLASAVVRGIDSADHDVIAVLDADLQHPPEKLPELIEALEGGAQMAIGSRFIEGGSTGDFGRARLAISKGADIVARSLFGLREVNDIQSGFFAFRKDIVNDSYLNPNGYKILLEILVKCDYGEATEVGYEFQDRYAGESKLGVKTVFSYLYHMLKLKLQVV